MHVLIICRSFPHHRSGGMEWHAQDIVEGLMAAGHTVSVITTPLPEEPALRELRVNGRIIAMGRKRASYDVGFLMDFVRHGRRAILETAPDVVHAQGFTGVIAANILPAHPPLLTTIHGTLWSETPLRRDNPDPYVWSRRARAHWRFKHRHFFSPFWKRFVKRSRFLVIDSKFTARILAREVGRLPHPATLVTPGFDLTRFPLGDRNAARREFCIAENEIALVTVGRLEEIKGAGVLVRTFLKIADQFPNARLILGGEGSDVPRLREMAQASPFADRINFLGRVMPEKLPKLLQAADLFLNADQGAPAFGLANAEALVMGTPVLTSNAGAHSEVVDCVLMGQLVRPWTEASWERHMRECMGNFPENPGRRDERAAAARERFGRDKMIERLVRLYRHASAVSSEMIAKAS